MSRISSERKHTTLDLKRKLNIFSDQHLLMLNLRGREETQHRKNPSEVNKILNTDIDYKKKMTALMNEKDEQIDKLRKEIIGIMKEKDSKINQLINEINELKNQMEQKRVNDSRKEAIYEQRMKLFNIIIEENKVYKDELNKVKVNQKNIEKKAEEKINSNKIKSELKMNQYKEKLLNDIKIEKDKLKIISM